VPSLAEALRFVREPATGEAQLRRACEILFLDSSGPSHVLRARLLEYLEQLDASQSVVCLNPRLTGEADTT
jgi:hypothetical protein